MSSNSLGNMAASHERKTGDFSFKPKNRAPNNSFTSEF